MDLPVNAVLGLAAAAAWGGGDFSGGMGVKAAGGSTRAALRVVVLAHLLSFVVLAGILWAGGAGLPHGALLGWGLLGGFAGGVSLTAFYIALARGAMGVSAAVSGLLAAAIPAVVSTFVEGAPGGLRLAGFALALVAIWVIAAGPGESSRGTLGLAVLAGVGFGIYFVALRMANPLGVFLPMTLARAGSLVTCGLALLFVRGESVRLTRAAWGWIVGVAVLDTGGNLLFIWATRLGRLDVAAVLASLYPASTILLAAWRLHERPTRRQVAGMGVALAAVVMITL